MDVNLDSRAEILRQKIVGLGDVYKRQVEAAQYNEKPFSGKCRPL